MKTYKLVLHTVKIWKLGVINNQLHMALVSLIHSFMQRWASRLSHFRLVSVLDRNDNKCGPKALWSHNPSTTKKHFQQRNDDKQTKKWKQIWPYGTMVSYPSTTTKTLQQRRIPSGDWGSTSLESPFTAYTAYTACVYCLHRVGILLTLLQRKRTIIMPMDYI